MSLSREAVVALPPTARAAGTARSECRSRLMEWRLHRVLDDALLIVSELVGNCIRHGLPDYWLVLRHRDRHLEIDVHDDGGGAPVLADAADDATSGRGLRIVAALADTVEVVPIPGDGKAVVAKMRVDSEL